jgi:pyridoxine kinase
MARILAISSFLAHGRVGLGATVPVLQALGHEVIQLPTVILSNHPGHPSVAGEAVAPGRLEDMLGALASNGWLGDVAAVVTGYLPAPRHVAFAAGAVRLVRGLNPAAVHVCDPILGDDPKGLYIDPEAAAAIKDRLVPLADVITPNRFELAWLTRRDVTGPEECRTAAETLAGAAVVATSIPLDADAAGGPRIANVLVCNGHGETLASPRRQDVPHGTGDVLTALVAGHLATAAPLPVAFERSHRRLEAIVAASLGREHLDLSQLTLVENLP